MTYPLAIITLYLIILSFQYITTCLLIRKLKVQYIQYELQKSGCVPNHYKKLFKTPIRELKSLDFIPVSYLKVREFVCSLPPGWGVLLYHRETKTYAIAGIRRPFEPVYSFDIEFYTFFKDERLLNTMNSKIHGVLGQVPNTIVQDVYADRISGQWQAHRDKLSEIAPTNPPRVLHPDRFLEIFQNNLKVYIDQLVKTKQIFPVREPGVFQYRWFSILKLTHKIIPGNKKTAKLVKRRGQQAKTDPSIRVDIPIELEIEQFERIQRLNRGLVGRRLRTWLLLGSLGLFVATFVPFISSLDLAILLGALLLHEGGHLLAMKLCQYRDTSMLFIPFLGAVAIAPQKEDATIAQKFWVFLAGPLPGLILGIGDRVP
ncbi:hypothetical protein IQ235_17680 [Oscillatoriales cyanobacterium LEGE 11467]|uniref:Peptidase M50 domain-containing protein n=1 Tax=Zarconia navalis LEGE 11467 TaxID=1828826 RepID=A0A928ZBE6_9CYAN|nr:site-2 protease family protein [Zarconia navalis]MBE9042596.1 hypothetical protein [Zarconia navalis LEGE 11467]